MMRKHIFAFALLVALAVATPRPGRQHETRNFIGEASSELATAILQGYEDYENDLAFSPFGYAAILAILSEGARGESQTQLQNALHLPEDKQLMRDQFKELLQQLEGGNENNAPEFRNWFYVYRNYTIRDDYKDILQKYYLTDVKSVERIESDPPIPEAVVDKAQSGATSDADSESKPEAEVPSKVVEKEDKKTEAKKASADAKPIENVEVDSAQSRTLFKDDITSSISGNTLGKKESNDDKSLMIVFNGMYYRGTWQAPFTKLEEAESFYTSPTQKKQVQMMEATGDFKYGFIKELDVEAVALPYQGGRYSLLLLVPSTRDGLRRLVADLSGTTLRSIDGHLKESSTRVVMPAFQAETTSKPVAALAKFGVTSIFGPNADLTGISVEDGLYVQDLVQHVTVRIDATGSSKDSLTASNGKSEEAAQSLTVDRPFLYFVRDTVDNVVIVAGKVVDPRRPSQD